MSAAMTAVMPGGARGIGHTLASRLLAYGSSIAVLDVMDYLVRCHT